MDFDKAAGAHSLQGDKASLPGAAVADTVERGVEFLAGVQLPHGEFPSYERSGPGVDSPGRLDSSPFVTTFVLYALSMAGTPSARPLIDRGARFLLDEQDANGLWRYWSSRNSRKIDPDLDDTCCASFVLRWLETPGFTPAQEAVFLANRAPVGLFKTWLRSPGAKNDFDSVVNANVLLYLGERPETAAACELLNRTINRGVEEATYHYYLDPLALYYMVSRAYAHGVRGFERCRDAIIRKTLTRQGEDGSFDDEMSSGLAICTLCNFSLADSPEVVRGTRYLARAQRSDGSWADHLFYAGPEPPASHSVWWSSQALTVALCIEAMCKATGGDGPRIEQGVRSLRERT